MFGDDWLERDEKDYAEDGAEFKEQQDERVAPLQENDTQVQQQIPLSSQMALQIEKAVGGAESTKEKATEKKDNARNQEGQEGSKRDNAHESADEEDQDSEERVNEWEDLHNAGSQYLETVGDALEYCKRIVEKQITLAIEKSTPMNEAISGDSEARRTIKTLLPEEQIRHLFLKTTQKRESWPRLRPLFGTPPYNFLRPEDAGVVRASGLARGRVNMAYEQAGRTATYAQFGIGHLTDTYLREYRVLANKTIGVGEILPFDFGSLQPSALVLINVRVPKRSKQEKREIMKDASRRRALVFPTVGERLVLRYSPALKRVWSRAEQDALILLRVKRVVPRSAGGSTAALVATNES